MKYFLILLISLFMGCTTPEFSTSASEIHMGIRPERCFHCEGKDFIPISYGSVPSPGHILYGLPVKEWRYHCVRCGKPTTGNQKKDQLLEKK